MFQRTRARRGLVVLMLATAAGCGGQGKPAGDLPVACDAYAQLNVEFFALPEQEGSAAETQGQAQTFAARAIPMAERVAAAMPSELRTPAKRFAKAIGTVGSTKAFDAVDTDEFFSDSVLIANHLGANCGLPGGNVEAVDHGFRGLPSTVPAGRPIALNVTNKGAEPHAMSILRATDGRPIMVAEVLATPRSELLKRFKLVSAVALEESGHQASLITVLEPGSYVVGCFLHEGGRDDQRTHAAAGMIAALVAT